MTDARQTFNEDLAFLRAMAESGRDEGGRLGGWLLVAAGVIFGGTGALLSSVTLSGITLDGLAIPLAYLVAGGVMMGFSVLLKRRLAAGVTLRSRVLTSAWRAVGLSIWAIVAGLGLLAARMDDWRVMSGMATVVLALYGMAWMTAAAICDRTWQRAVGWAAFALAILMGAIITRPLGGLIFSAAVALLLAGPGVVILRRVARA